MTFVTDCVHSTAEKIDAMTEAATPIDVSTFIDEVGVAYLRTIPPFDFYAWGDEPGIRLERDPYVSAYRSTYDGVPCLFIEHSRIEYVFAADEADQEWWTDKELRAWRP